ncbi:hypothetical protein L6452_38054 [Arctium lappa]|uniref:Uncharacterized protein n=1 Tax=Arctium lappa TaxID=4217 RepID=A0ACB8Y5B1_ARCLA|nr:hypothetical protein L6452_38054 [Arctium lappa]
MEQKVRLLIKDDFGLFPIDFVLTMKMSFQVEEREESRSHSAFATTGRSITKSDSGRKQNGRRFLFGCNDYTIGSCNQTG